MTGNGSVVVFGAGSIGRGLIGQLVYCAGGVPVFVEAATELRARLAEAGRYTVRLTGREHERIAVERFRVAAPEDDRLVAMELASCAFAATAVGGEHLQSVARLLATVLRHRRDPLPLVICENWPDAAGVMAAHLAEHRLTPAEVACIPASVERMVRPGEGLDLVGESCETLLVDRAGWPGESVAIEGLRFVDRVEPYYKRKLYTNNAGHALLAYEGALHGCRYLAEALDVAGVASRLQTLLATAADALSATYGLDRSALTDHLRDLVVYRYPNRELGDTVARVGRHPLRKLGPSERLTGLLRIVQRCGLDCEPVHRTIAAALHYRDAGDDQSVEMGRAIGERGPGAVLESVCGILPSDPSHGAILRHYASLARPDA